MEIETNSGIGTGTEKDRLLLNTMIGCIKYRMICLTAIPEVVVTLSDES